MFLNLLSFTIAHYRSAAQRSRSGNVPLSSLLLHTGQINDDDDDDDDDDELYSRVIQFKVCKIVYL